LKIQPLVILVKTITAVLAKGSGGLNQSVSMVAELTWLSTDQRPQM